MRSISQCMAGWWSIYPGWCATWCLRSVSPMLPSPSAVWAGHSPPAFSSATLQIASKVDYCLGPPSVLSDTQRGLITCNRKQANLHHCKQAWQWIFALAWVHCSTACVHCDPVFGSQAARKLRDQRLPLGTRPSAQSQAPLQSAM